MIYKFFSNIEFLFSTINDSQLWFSKVEDFNDPFEWAFPYKIDIEKNKADIIKYVKDNSLHQPPQFIDYKINEYLSNPKKLEDELNATVSYRRKKGVCCFTVPENNCSILMWSHYANNHKGFVLGFNENDMNLVHIKDWINGTKISKTYIKNVNYEERLCHINPFDKDRPDIKEVEFIKSPDWENENEIRIVSPLHGLHDFNPSSLKEIIFGLNIPENIIQKFISYIKHTEKLSQVQIKQCKKHERELKIEIKYYEF
jgi:hypothetical protein